MGNVVTTVGAISKDSYNLLAHQNLKKILKSKSRKNSVPSTFLAEKDC